MPDLFAASSLVWPLAFLLVALLVLRQLREDVRPIFRGMVGGLAQTAAGNAQAYAMCLIYAMAASMQALAEVATSLGWLYVAAAAKVLQPGLVAVIAYVTRGSSFRAPVNPPAASSPANTSPVP